MSVIYPVIAVAVLAVVLLVVVVRVSKEVRTLRREVEELRRGRGAPGPISAESPQSAPAALRPAPEGADAVHPDDVSVITGLGTPSRDDGPTTAQIASVSLGGPLIKVAALPHGLRQALREEQRMRIAYAFRKELRRQRKMRRRRHTEQAGSQGWVR